MEYWIHSLQREHFWSRAEKVTRYMCNSCDSQHTNGNSSGFGSQSMDSNVSISLEPEKKRRRFSLRKHLRVLDRQKTQTDDVSRYKSTELVQFCLDPDSFVSDPFSGIQF